MGNQHGKASGQKLFTGDELKILEASYRATSSGTKILESWKTIIDEYLAECTANYLYTAGQPAQQRATSIALMQYAQPYYIVDRGTFDEKLNFLTSSLEKNDTNQLHLKELEKYITAVLRSYLNIQTQQMTEVLDSWKKYGYQITERSILAFSKCLIRSLPKESEHRVALDKLENWLQVNPTFLIIWREVFIYLYGKYAGKPHKLGSNQTETINILPCSEGLLNYVNYTPILDLPHVIYINSHLPNELRHKWRMLFSSNIMGESFSTMLGKILHKGPTLIVVEDEDRHIFAGYAPDSWSLKPNFVGDESSMLFTLSPAMRCFTATGYNNHYQYLNINQQTMPNGLGMGGQFNYWGLWIDCDYGLGQSAESCTTYNEYVQLSKRKDFRIRSLEVWGIGDEPKLNEYDDDEENIGNKHSVLDKNLEDRVMLELAGTHMHSDGFREPDMDL